MASPQVTVRMDPESYKALVMLARVEEKTIAELTRALIEDGLKARKSTKIPESSHVIERLDEVLNLLKRQPGDKPDVSMTAARLESRLMELVLKAIRAAAAGQSYARQAAIAAQDIASMWDEQINASESSQSRKDAIGRMDADSQDFAQWWVKNG